jgi:hypothetical protein
MPISRRTMLRTITGGLAYTAKGGLRQGLAQTNETCSASCAPLIPCMTDTIWVNKHENVRHPVSRLYRPVNRTSECLALGQENAWQAGLEGLEAILREVERTGKRTRAVGGTWSLSDAATCPDFMIDTSFLNYHAPIANEHVLPFSAIPPRLLYFAQCGTSVEELNTDLQARGLCLRTSGASQGQTICGAFSTGTHGSALGLGAMQDYIVGMHILVGPGKSYWLEQKSQPIVTDSFCRKLEAERWADDELFSAALVSFGCFGIIHSVLIEVEDIYSLKVCRSYVDWSAVRTMAGSLDFAKLPELIRCDDNRRAPAERPFHFEVDMNPYQAGEGQKGVSLVAMYKLPFTAPPPCKLVHMEAGVDVLAIVGGLSTTLPFLVAPVTNHQFHSIWSDSEPCDQGPRGNVFNATQIKGKSMSCEIGVSLHDAVQAMEVLIATAKAHPFPGLLTMRYVWQSKAMLAFTRFPVTCTIELPAAASQRTRQYYTRAFDALKAVGIPFTLHWGQMNDLNEGNVRARWGDDTVSRWIQARRRLLSAPGERYRFSNDLSDRCGLSI